MVGVSKDERCVRDSDGSKNRCGRQKMSKEKAKRIQSQ